MPALPALPVPQQSDWNNNVYVVATTRIFVMIGMAYLIKSLYNLMSSIWGTRSASIAAVISDVIGLEDIISDTPATMPGAVSTDPDLEANLTLEIRPPQTNYDPQNHAERSRANARAQDQSTEVSGSFTADHAMPEQDVGVRNDDPRTEECMDTAVGLTG